MSVLIRGMEMPKNVSLWLVIRPDGTTYKIKNGANYGEPQTGKAVQIPEGHGRLGDLDALSKEFEHLASLDWNQKAAPYSWAYAYSEAQAAVDDSPTIVPAEGGTDDDGNA